MRYFGAGKMLLRYWRIFGDQITLFSEHVCPHGDASLFLLLKDGPFRCAFTCTSDKTPFCAPPTMKGDKYVFGEATTTYRDLSLNAHVIG